ncbi:MAG: co-chaperone GroES [Candidatus Nitrosocaldus sp.]
MPFPVRPLGDRVVVELIDVDATSAGGIVMPTYSAKFRYGKVVAVGRGNVVNGTIVPLEVNVGDIVQFTAHTGDQIVVGGKEYLVIPERVIVAVVDDNVIKHRTKKLITESKNNT